MNLPTGFMHIAGYWGLAGLLALTPAALAAEPLDADLTVFEDVNVLTMEDGDVLRRFDVVIGGGKIRALARHDTLDIGENVRRINGREKYLMPGLTDPHIHIWKDVAERSHNRDAARLLLVNGLTRARVAFGPPLYLEWRDRVNEGREPGARLIIASPYFGTDSETEDFNVYAESAEDARRYVAAFAEAGYDYVKIASLLNTDLLDAILDEARAQGIPVMGHFPGADFQAEKVVTGQWKGVEHFNLMIRDTITWEHDEAELDALAALFKANGTAISSVAFGGTEISAGDHIARDWRRFNELGVNILAGTEGNFGPGGLGAGLVAELIKFTEMGLSNYDAIRTATVNAAPYLSEDGRIGTIREGYEADLTLLDANPLEDIQALRKLAGVMVGGKWYDCAALNEIEAGIED